MKTYVHDLTKHSLIHTQSVCLSVSLSVSQNAFRLYCATRGTVHIHKSTLYNTRYHHNIF